MSSVLVCPIKINLTLRIMDKRSDGYHELFSAFWKKNGAERLTINTLSRENIKDELEVRGALLEGENLLTKALRLARAEKADIPPLRMILEKAYPAGSGIGAGSGNAAALVSYLRENYAAFAKSRDVAALGADVAFLAEESGVAMAEGIGEKLTPAGELEGLYWTLAFPKWTSGTAAAYAELDEYRALRGDMPGTDLDYRAEACGIIALLKKKERAGLLPNDFLSITLAKHEEYETAFRAAARTSLAWGLCGSGSALFAVCGDFESAKRTEHEFANYNWAAKTAVLE